MQLKVEHQRKRRGKPTLDENGERVVTEKFSRNTKTFNDVGVIINCFISFVI